MREREKIQSFIHDQEVTEERASERASEREREREREREILLTIK